MFLVLELAVVTLGVGLPGLVKGLEVEDIDAPGEHGADGILVVFFGEFGAGLGSAVVGSAIYSR